MARVKFIDEYANSLNGVAIFAYDAWIRSRDRLMAGDFTTPEEINFEEGRRHALEMVLIIAIGRKPNDSGAKEIVDMMR